MSQVLLRGGRGEEDSRFLGTRRTARRPNQFSRIGIYTSGVISDVQLRHRLAFVEIAEQHSGQSRVLVTGGARRLTCLTKMNTANATIKNVSTLLMNSP